jgi:hypothetical protein
MRQVSISIFPTSSYGFSESATMGVGGLMAAIQVGETGHTVFTR